VLVEHHADCGLTLDWARRDLQVTVSRYPLRVGWVRRYGPDCHGQFGLRGTFPVARQASQRR
jgi:hypothetical protein